MDERKPQTRALRLRRAVLPRTQPGRIAVWFFVAFAICLAILCTIVAARGGSPWLAPFVPALAVTAFGGGIAALIAVVRHGERGFLLFLPVLIALVAIVFALGEVIVPH